MNAAEAAKVHLREDVKVDVGYSATGFTTNVTAIRAEERLALAVRRPTMVVSVTALN
jgi:predicted rRNA methylase YqxC with S4 and FtsJ domains